MDSNLVNGLIDGLKAIGDEINEWRYDEKNKVVHEPKQFKTEADFKANQAIKDLILSFDKTATIISEEDNEFDASKPPSYWLIDPIDGTASWYEGFNGFVTQIAYIQDGVPIFGVICAPALNNTWWAIKDKGAYLNGNALHTRQAESFEHGFSLVDNYPKPKRIAKILYEGMSVKEYIESGSLGLKSVLVADGTADVFIKDVLIRDWDVAPAHVILNELGCHLSDLQGQPILFTGLHEKNDGLLVAANSSLAQEVVSFIGRRSQENTINE